MNAILKKTLEPLIILAVRQVLEQITTRESMVKFIDGVLDTIENKIAETETKWDDRTIGVICQAIRKQFEIPDDDDLTDPV